MRWDLIEKFETLKKGGVAKALRNFSGQEDFFAEHFPGNPLVPEPLFVEMIAQVGGVLFGLGLDFKKEVILADLIRLENLVNDSSKSVSYKVNKKGGLDVAIK